MRSTFLIAITILAVGCGEKVESTTETKPVEEKVLEVKEEVKPVEPVAETKPELEGVSVEEIEPREGLAYVKGSDTPYTGKFYGLYDNGQKRWEGNYKDGEQEGLWVAWHKNGQKLSEANFKGGKEDGLEVWWHENGQKRSEQNYKDGRKVEGSEKYWNSKGEPVDSEEEAWK